MTWDPPGLWASLLPLVWFVKPLLRQRSKSRLQGVPNRLFVDLQELRYLPPRRAGVLHAPGQLHLVVGERPSASQGLAPGSCRRQALPGAPASHLALLVSHPRRHADHLVANESERVIGRQLQKPSPALRLVEGPDLHSPGPQGDDALKGVQPPSSDPVDADHNQDIASGKVPVQAVPALALVRAGGSGDADVSVDVIPLDAGLSEPEFLAEWVHSSHALLEVAGPDVSEEGHAARLRFIRTGRNTEMTPDRGAEQSGVSAAFMS